MFDSPLLPEGEHLLIPQQINRMANDRGTHDDDDDGGDGDGGDDDATNKLQKKSVISTNSLVRTAATMEDGEENEIRGRMKFEF